MTTSEGPYGIIDVKMTKVVDNRMKVLYNMLAKTIRIIYFVVDHIEWRKEMWECEEDGEIFPSEQVFIDHIIKNHEKKAVDTWLRDEIFNER